MGGCGDTARHLNSLTALTEERRDMNPELCPKRDTCSRLKMARLARVCLHCSGIEPVESICARCEEKEKTRGSKPVLAV
jgi:uncharacterized paraquat-inducible protein A